MFCSQGFSLGYDVAALQAAEGPKDLNKTSYELKDLLFHYPVHPFTGFNRNLSCIRTERAAWAAAQMEAAGKNRILIVRRSEQVTSSFVLDTMGACHRPCLVSDPNNTVTVIWNENESDERKLKCASISKDSDSFGDIQTIACSKDLYLQPTATYFNNELWVAWPALVDGTIRINVIIKDGAKWRGQKPVSGHGIDAFRPCLCAGPGGVFLAWDQYNNRTYEIAYRRFNGSEWSDTQTLSHPRERWLCPQAVASDEGTRYLTWVVLKEVSDKLGIVDHFPFAMAAAIREDRLEYLLDNGNAIDNRICADLREGLLASEIYKGYLGLRRHPMLSLSEQGELWCLWEVRMESDGTAVPGHLAGRQLQDDQTWSEPYLVCEDGPSPRRPALRRSRLRRGESGYGRAGGYGYCAADSFSNHTIPVTFFQFDEKGADIVGIDFADLKNKRPYRVDHTKWARWQDIQLTPINKARRQTLWNNNEYSLFWADTHCHSNFSADAEGEPDEIIHFARDIAGLDAVCVIDNDYYPHKSLTHAEWQIHQDFSAHFTRPGEFVVFPGYEFTYHRKNLSPDFNHRCVIYPGPGGKMFRRIDSESNTDKKLMKKLRGTSAMCYPHHVSYDIIDQERDWNVEICSSWRICMEESDFTVKQLLQGKKFGFVGSSDTHRAVPGLGGALTGIYAETLTPEALFDAYRHRRTIATQGFEIFIDFRVAGAFIGGETECGATPDIDACVRAYREIEFVEVIRDGKAIFRETPGRSECEFKAEDDSVEAGEHFYFLRVKLVGDPSFNTDPSEKSLKAFSNSGIYRHNLARARGVFAWTSPVWVTIRG